jgi:hypothetical protein
MVVSGDCHARWPGCPGERCLGRAGRGPCADAGRVPPGSLSVPAPAHGMLARERTDASIAGAMQAVGASPRVPGADRDGQRAFLPLDNVPAIPTVSLDVVSLVASSCGHYREHIEQRAAHECAVHVATLDGFATRIQYRHPPRAQPVAPLRERHCRGPRLPPRRCTAQALSRPQGQPGGAPGRQQQPHRLPMPRHALPTRFSSFCLLVMASPPRDTRRDPLISQQTSGIVGGADRRCIAGALAAFLLTAGRVARRSYPLQSRRPGRDDGGIISPPDHIERPPIGLTVSSSTPTMAPVIARPIVHGRGLPQGAATRHEIRPLYPGLMD